MTGEDYTTGPYYVTFNAGVTSASFAIAITKDNVFEGLEYFTLILKTSALLHRKGVQVIYGSLSQSTVFIDDERDGE